MSALSEIFDALDALLTEIDGVESYERMPTGDPDAFPALVLYDDGDSPIEQESGSTRLSLSITVEGYAEGASGAAAHNQMSELHAAAVKALCADPTLGGLVELVEVTGKRRVDVAELASERRLGFAQDFEIQYSTKRGDPSTFA